MDLIRLLRSLEEFLYELVGWLVFYPRNLWRVLVHPGEVAHYTRREFSKDPEQRFAEAISPRADVDSVSGAGARIGNVYAHRSPRGIRTRGQASVWE